MFIQKVLLSSTTLLSNVIDLFDCFLILHNRLHVVTSQRCAPVKFRTQLNGKPQADYLAARAAEQDKKSGEAGDSAEPEDLLNQ